MNLDLLAQKQMNKPDRIAFLSENMNLSSDEAEKFWPLLNDMENELKALKKELKENKPEKKVNEMSDKEIQFELKKHLASYMLPSRILFKKSLPLVQSDKNRVNKEALQKELS